MRDRLIELIESARYWGANTSEEIADHFLAEGVIVPPCKVGDIVYTYTHFWRKEDGISPYQITNITLTQNKKGIWTKKYRAMEVQNGKTIDWQLNFEFDAIGKTVFLAREEAEKALERSKNDC